MHHRVVSYFSKMFFGPFRILECTIEWFLLPHFRQVNFQRSMVPQLRLLEKHMAGIGPKTVVMSIGIANWKMATEIVDLSIESMVIFHSDVSLPEGTADFV